MAPTISLSPNRYTTQLPAHRFRQGNRDVYYFTLDWPHWMACCPIASRLPWSRKPTAG